MSKYLELKKKALLMGSNVFWLPSGFSSADVVSAYRFKGVSTADFARQDLSGNGYDLTVVPQTYNGNTYTPSWDSANGYSFAAVYQGLSGYLDNPDLNSANIKSAVICYSGVTQGNRAYLVTAGGSSGRVQIYAATTAVVCDSWSGDQPVNQHIQNYGGPGFAANSFAEWGWVGRMAYSGSSYKAGGVIGVNFDTPKMYLDGTEAALSYTPSGNTWTDSGSGWQTIGNAHTNYSSLNNEIHAGKTIIAAAFFSEELSAAQHAEVASMMLGM